MKFVILALFVAGGKLWYSSDQTIACFATYSCLHSFYIKWSTLVTIMNDHIVLFCTVSQPTGAACPPSPPPSPGWLVEMMSVRTAGPGRYTPLNLSVLSSIHFLLSYNMCRSCLFSSGVSAVQEWQQLLPHLRWHSDLQPVGPHCCSLHRVWLKKFRKREEGMQGAEDKESQACSRQGTYHTLWQSTEGRVKFGFAI